MKWWINREGEPPKGPYNWQELATLSGFYEDTLVSREGDKNWVEAAEDPELESLFESPMEGAKLRSQLRLRSADVQGSEEEFEDSSALRSHPVTPSDPKRSNGDHGEDSPDDTTLDSEPEPASGDPESTPPDTAEPVRSNGDASHPSGEETDTVESTADESPETSQEPEGSSPESETIPADEEIIDYAKLDESSEESEDRSAETKQSPGEPDVPAGDDSHEESPQEVTGTREEPSDTEDTEAAAVVIPTEGPDTPQDTDEPSPEFDPSVSIPPRPPSEESREPQEVAEEVGDPGPSEVEPDRPEGEESFDSPVIPESKQAPTEESLDDETPPVQSGEPADGVEPAAEVPGPNGESPPVLDPQPGDFTDEPSRQTESSQSDETSSSPTDSTPEPEEDDRDQDESTSVPIPGTAPEPVPTPNQTSQSSPARNQPFAGVLPRTLAFLTDGVLLGLVGVALGLVNFSFLADLGSAGRLIGFLGALWYFGVGNSWVTWGQTPGKYLFGIRVLGRDGEPLSLPLSLLRFSIIGIPFFLFNIKLGGAAYTEFFFLPLRTVLTLSVFGLGGGLLYVFLINRRSRRSLHDYLADSVVIEKDADQTYEELPTQIPRLHRWVLGSWVAALFLGTIIMPFYWSQFPTIDSMNRVEQSMLRSGTYHSVRIQPSPGEYLKLTRAGGPVTSVQVDLWFQSSPTDMNAKLRRVGEQILRALPSLPPDAQVVIQGHYGFDLGVSRYFNSHSVRLTPTPGSASPADSRQDTTSTN